MPSHTIPVVLVLCLAQAACRCASDEPGRSRHEETADPIGKQPPATKELPPPPAETALTAAPADPRFGPATIELMAAGDIMRVHPKITIPAGQAAAVPDETVQPCSISFDHGPPIAIRLVARGGFWDGGEVPVPTAVRPAKMARIAIQTRPQTTYQFTVEGAWDRVRPEAPATIESIR